MRCAVVACILIAGCGARTSRGYYGPAGFQVATQMPQPQGAQQVAPGWVLVEPQRAGFSCQMPGQARVDVQSGYSEDGATFHTVHAGTRVPYGTFGMISTMWEQGVVGDPLAVADALADRILEIAELRGHRTTRVSMPGFYAREDTGLADARTFVALRQFFGRYRIYVAVVAVPYEPTGLRAAEHFMQSIAIDGQDAALPSGESTVPVPLYLPEADFAAAMPPLASRSSSPIDVGDQTLEAWAFESRHAHGVYRVTVVAFDRDERPPDDPLTGVASTLSLGTPVRYLHASGFPGAAYEPGGDRSVRAFVTEGRVYVVEVTAASQLGQAGAERFFDSFRIL